MADETHDEGPGPSQSSEKPSGDPPDVLDYGTSSPSGTPSAVDSVIGSTVGLLVGLAAVAVVSAVPYLMYLLEPHGMPLVVRCCALLVFAVLAAGGIRGTIRYRRARPWSGRSAFGAGFVLGVGIAALLEGICFGLFDWG